METTKNQEQKKTKRIGESTKRKIIEKKEREIGICLIIRSMK